MEFNEPAVTPGIEILGTEELLDIAEQEANGALEAEAMPTYSELSGHIQQQFRINKESKRNSGIETDITNSLMAYNGEYSGKDKARISAEGGSAIFMQLTAIKSRNAASWIRDILLPANGKSWDIEPSPMADLPEDLKQSISKSINDEFEELAKAKMDARAKEAEAKAQQQQQAAQGQGQPGEQPQSQQKAEGPVTEAGVAQETVRELNQEKRDILESTYEEIQREAKFNMKFMERHIDDQFLAGGYYNMLSTFIDDFTVFPTAFSKGPVITMKNRMTWKNGQPVVAKDFVFTDKRISPYDIYPAPEASCLLDGALCEHLRLSRSEVYDLSESPGYDADSVLQVLEDTTMGATTPYWLDTGVESDKADQEKRGDQFEANRNIIHGIHFWGSVSANILLKWGMRDGAILMAHPEKQFEVEAILLNEVVVKCALNSDPLLRRPYRSASYQKRPGSIWGRSLPMLMDDVQRMCNATARALSNNMALASGPQIEIYIDRLADDGEIENIRPFKIWQLTTDPSGGSGRAINFFQPTSNASELLAVYEKFEQRADDATGIPRYAYGNEKTGGAATTASGLAMLFESSSKMIKDAIRNIDSGVIVPRVEEQFYWNIIKNEIDFTGDIQVRALGSSTLTVKGAEQMRRNEFLQITANPIDQQLMGDGRAELLSEMAKDLGFVEDIVPGRLDRKKNEKKKAENAQAAQEAEMAMVDAKAKANNIGAETQINGQKEMAGANNNLQQMQEDGKNQRHKETIAIKNKEIEAFNSQNGYRLMQQSASDTANRESKENQQTKELAVKLSTGSGI